MKGLTRIGLILGALAITPLAWAQQQKPVSSFLQQAAQTNIAEVEMAEVAQERAASEAVKNMAQHIQQDHELANERLQAIAEKNNVELPDETDKMHQQKMEQLSKLEGRQFDQQYVQAMIEGHKKVIQQFEQQAKTAQDPQVKQYAEMTLPQLRSHLEQAQQLQKDMDAERTQAPQQKQEQRQ